MSNVIIEHEDGRRYSVPKNDPRTREDGWTVEGAETEDSFKPVGIPAQRPPRKRPAAKNAAPVKAPETPAEGG